MERKRKDVIIDCKKVKCEVQISNTRMKQVQKFRYLCSVLTQDEKWDAGIRIVKDA